MENQKNQLQEGWIRLPGLIDVHVHFREPGQEWKEDWTTGTAAALAGGVTLVCAMPNTRPPLIDLETLELTRQLAGQKSLCDWALYCGGSNNSFTLNPLLAPHCVALKLYLDHTFTTLQLDDMSVWSQHFRSFPPDRPVVVHAEKANMAAAILHAHLLRRPIHIAHVSLAQEIELIRQCKQNKIQVTCEVTPHHLFLCEEDDVPRLGDLACVCPALSKKKDVEALWANLDVIDCFATDHAPHLLSEKSGPHFAPGFAGLETALPLFLTAVKEGKLTLEQIIEKMHTNPRRIFNLPEQPDTWIEVDPNCEWIVRSDQLHSKCAWTPFEGRSLRGRIKKVVLRGHTAFLDDRGILVPPGFGIGVFDKSPQ